MAKIKSFITEKGHLGGKITKDSPLNVNLPQYSGQHA